MSENSYNSSHPKNNRKRRSDYHILWCNSDERLLNLCDNFHHSEGKLSQSFADSVAYVRQKYSKSVKRYATIVGRLNTFGGDSSRPVFKWKRIPWIMLRYNLAQR